MLLLLCLATLFPPPAEEFKELFNGKDLDGWVKEAATKSTGVPKWSVTPEGEIRCEAALDGFGFLRYDREQYGDFVLKLEYRFEPQSVAKFKGNSGIGIRTGKFDPKQSGATRPSYASYEIQLLDDAGTPATKHCTGSLYRYLAPKENKAKASPEWNQLEIACEGPRIRVKLNGTEIVNEDQTQIPDLPSPPKTAKAPKDKPLNGFIALQSHTGTVLFRKVAIRRIGSK